MRKKIKNKKIESYGDFKWKKKNMKLILNMMKKH